MPAKEHVIESDLDRIDKLRDENIDYSDIPELGDEMFAKPLPPWPPRKERARRRTTKPCVLDHASLLRGAYSQCFEQRLGAVLADRCAA
jgi:hypothetical protein